MLSNNYTKDLLNLQGVIVDKIEHFSDTVKIHIHLPIKPHKCKACNQATTYVHDYRIRTIKDVPAFGKFERNDRLQVKYFVSDMWKPYAELARTYFKNAIPIVDKYHYIKQII